MRLRARKGTPPCQLLPLLQPYANRPNTARTDPRHRINPSNNSKEGGGGEGKICTREVCSYREMSVVQCALRILSLTTPSFSHSLNLLTWGMFNFCERQCNQWQEGKHLWRETAEMIKVLQLYPKIFPSPGEKMRLLKGKWEERRGKWGHNKMNLYPPELSLSSRPSCFCPAAPALCSPTNEGSEHSLLWNLPCLLPLHRTGEWKRSLKKAPGDWSDLDDFDVVCDIFVALSGCQGAASPVTTRGWLGSVSQLPKDTKGSGWCVCVQQFTVHCD